MGGNNALRITTGSTSTNVAASVVQGYVLVRNGLSEYAPSTQFFWPSNGTVEIPFEAFVGFDAEQVTGLTVGIAGGAAGPSANTAPQQDFTASASFTRIEVVPGPGAIAMLAAGRVALAGGLIRRRLAAKV